MKTRAEILSEFMNGEADIADGDGLTLIAELFREVAELLLKQ